MKKRENGHTTITVEGCLDGLKVCVERHHAQLTYLWVHAVMSCHREVMVGERVRAAMAVSL